MITRSLLTRYILYGLGIAVIFLVLAHFTTEWMMQISEGERRRMNGGPVAMLEFMLSEIKPEMRVEYLKKLQRAVPNQRIMSDIALLDGDGKPLYVPESGFPFNDADRTIELSGSQKLLFKMRGFPRPGGAPGPRDGNVRMPPPPGPPGGFWRIFLIQAAALIGAVLFTVVVMILTLRAKSKIANSVIQELTHGNLRARFPVSRVDEVGQMMNSFNTMADEIERLIESLRKSETVRRDLLRELAHDLRTPIASLKTLIEAAATKAVDEKKRGELLALAERETDYFAGLVEDLLFLGRVSEPQYKENLTEFNLTDLVNAESEAVGSRFSKIRIDFRSEPEVIIMASDASLIRRLVRNALENAFSFARQEVAIRLREIEGEIEIIVIDDGQGFSKESLASFGQRKFSRAIAMHQDGRISIGLGSVIMKSIVEAYRGVLKVQNVSRKTGETGAQVLIRLPK